MGKITVKAGALTRGYIRRALDKAKFNEIITGYTESKGFLDSDFFVTGNDAGIVAVSEYIDRISQ